MGKRSEGGRKGTKSERGGGVRGERGKVDDRYIEDKARGLMERA